MEVYLKRAVVKGLFDSKTQLEMELSNNVNCIHGVNGSGKTVFINLLVGTLNCQLEYLKKIKFSSITIYTLKEEGWIALALVVFSTWMPGRLAAGAYLFGGVWILGLYAQGMGVGIPSQLLSSLPYVATILALIIISTNRRLSVINTPASLGQGFVPDR